MSNKNGCNACPTTLQSSENAIKLHLDEAKEIKSGRKSQNKWTSHFIHDSSIQTKVYLVNFYWASSENNTGGWCGRAIGWLTPFFTNGHGTYTLDLHYGSHTNNNRASTTFNLIQHACEWGNPQRIKFNIWPRNFTLKLIPVTNMWHI